MNLSKLAVDSLQHTALHEEVKVDNTPALREQEQKVLKIIEALQGVQKSKHWSTLKIELFDPLVATLESGIKDEAKKEQPDTLKLNRLAGQLRWAEKYSDLGKLEKVFKTELTRIRKNLYA